MTYHRRVPPRDRTRRRIVPTQARARASVDAILTATEQLLRERGYARLTTNHIAARAGVNVALVYRYFAGKEAIVGALIDRVADATVSALQATLAAHARSPLPVAVRAIVDVLVGTPSVPALHRELTEHVDAAHRRVVVRDIRAAAAARFRELLVARRAELRPDADLDALLFVLEPAIEAATNAAAFYRPADLSLDRAVTALCDVITRALLPVEDRPDRGASRPRDRAETATRPPPRRRQDRRRARPLLARSARRDGGRGRARGGRVRTVRRRRRP